MAPDSPNIRLSPNQFHPPSPAPSRQSSLSRGSLQIIEANPPPQPPGGGENDAAQSPVAREPYARLRVRRSLTSRDVCAFIINKMIGTGIFTGPPVILSYIGKKSSSLGLWVAGFVYTLLSMIIFLELARKLPFTGGELVYLDALWRHPRLLAYTCYSVYFVCLYATATSSMQFASQVIMAATKSDDIPDQRVMRLIAIAILSLVCLLLYFSTTFGRKLNRYSAVLKVVLMIVVIIAGGIKARKNPAQDITKRITSVKSGSATALLQVLYSFQGWENATLIAGEIHDYRALRRGFIAGVCLVGILYILVNFVYCYAIPWDSNDKPELQFVALFFGNSERAQMAWQVLTALSAATSNLSVTYTTVRVKQTIAWTNILPWSTFWRKYAPIRVEEPNDPVEMQPLMADAAEENDRADMDQDNEPPETETSAPQGGIALHWVASVVQICMSSAIGKVTEAISFPGLVLTYGQSIFGVILGLLFTIHYKIKYNIPSERGWNAKRQDSCFDHLIARWGLGLIYAASSFVILVLAGRGPNKNTDGSERKVKGWWFPVITFGLLIFSILYYLIFIASENRNGASFAGMKMQRRKHVRDDNGNVKRRCDQCIYHRPSQEHRHYRDGYLYYNDFQFGSGNHGKSWLYWFFGGPKECHHPDFHLEEYPGDCYKMIISSLQGIWGRIQNIFGGARG